MGSLAREEGGAMSIEVLLLAAAVAQAAPAEPVHRCDVTVELRNGSRIDGKLVSEEAGLWVLGVAGGEMRFTRSQVLRVVPRDEAALRDCDPAIQAELEPPKKQVQIDLPGPATMSFQVPATWVETRLEGRELALKDPSQSVVFGVSTVEDAHSLWSLTPGIKRQYGSLYSAFSLEQERVAAAGTRRSWELEFRYEKDGAQFREIQLIVDFGASKRIFAFTAAAEKFSAAVAQFRAIVASFQYDRPAEASGEPAGNGPARSGDVR
jgi:hypothetical protein